MVLMSQRSLKQDPVLDHTKDRLMRSLLYPGKARLKFNQVQVPQVQLISPEVVQRLYVKGAKGRIL